MAEMEASEFVICTQIFRICLKVTVHKKFVVGVVSRCLALQENGGNVGKLVTVSLH